MTQQDRELLLKDLCARLPYGVKFQWENTEGACSLYSITPNDKRTDAKINSSWRLESCKPYLRPMSSMTEEEENELVDLDCAYFDSGKYTDEDGYSFIYGEKTFQLLTCLETYDWLNAHHFDYRDLIERGLAIAVTEENNPYKN